MINHPVKYVNHKDNYKLTITWLLVTVILTINTLVLGFTGFYIGEGIPLLDSIYSTLRLFILDFDSIADGTLLTLEIARWSAVIIVFCSVIFFFTTSFYYYFKFLLYRFSRKTIVVIGLNASSLEFIKDLRERKRKVIAIAFQSDPEIISQAIHMGVMIIVGELNDTRTYKSANVLRAKQIVLFSDEDATNIESLVFLIDRLLMDGPRHNYHIKIHIKSRAYAEFIEQIEQEYLPKISIYPFNIYRNMVKKVYRDLPFYKKHSSIDAPVPHILIIGLGDLGIQFLEQVLELGHFPSLKKMSITIMDCDMQALLYCEEMYKPFVEYFTIHMIHHDALTYDYTNLATQDQPDYIVMTISNDHINMQIANKLVGVFNESKIVARLFRHEQLSAWINKNIKRYEHLYSYSISKDIVSEDIILNEQLEHMGREFHEVYQLVEGIDKPWESLSSYYKNSNILLAEHSKVKLNAIGLQLIELENLRGKAGGKARAEEVSAGEGSKVRGAAKAAHINTSELNEDVHRILEEYKYSLAVSEHNRWCAFLRLNGYQWNEQRDDSLKLHPLLIEWDKLSEQQQAKNIAFIDTILQVLQYKYTITLEKCEMRN